jgi:hypothetical protein
VTALDETDDLVEEGDLGEHRKERRKPGHPHRQSPASARATRSISATVL